VRGQEAAGADHCQDQFAPVPERILKDEIRHFV
jgi:hypothetical protein